VLWSGPYAAQSAALGELLRAHQPAALPDGTVHNSDWRWLAVDFQPFTVSGSPQVSAFQDVAAAPRLAVADPERSEIGLWCVLAVLERARLSEGDAELGWAWWQRRVQAGITLTDDEANAQAALSDRRVTHALTLHDAGEPLLGLAPVPHAMSISASARELDGARRVLDWLASAESASLMRFSAWQAASNGLQAVLSSAPPLDVEFATRQYTAVRQRWAASGFGLTLKGP
jgi:hypothetical protein